MKKNYVMPQVEVMKIETVSFVAASPAGKVTTVSGNSGLGIGGAGGGVSARSHGFDFDDDEDF